MKSSVIGLTVLLVIVTIFTSIVFAATTTTTCIYSLGPYGDAAIKVKSYNPGGILVLTIPLEKNALTSTLLVYNENGTPLDFTVKNNEVVVDAANSTTVWIEYSAVVGNVTDNIVNATIHPVGPATIYLPRGAALLGFNGTAVVDYVSDRIVLRYSNAGTYNIVYLVPQQTTTTTPQQTTTTTTVTRTTTTQTTTPITTTTTKTTTTTSSITMTSETTTTTTTTKTSSATKTTQTTSTTSSTTSTTKKTPTQPMTSTKPATSTTSTSTSQSASPSTTSTTPVSKSNKAQAIAAGITAIAVIIALALLLSRRRGGATTGALVDGGSPGTGGTGASAEVTLVASSLDDRDKAILDLLSKEGPLGVSEIARRLGISKSTAWRKLQKLVDMGLVERIVVNGTPLYRVKSSERR